MALTPAEAKNIGSIVYNLVGISTRTPTSGTAITGPVIFRNDNANNFDPQSAILTLNASWSLASGDVTGVTTLKLELMQSYDAAFDSPTSYADVIGTVTWVADGANSAFLTLPVDLSSANNYIAAKATYTHAGTGTWTVPLLSVDVLLAGQNRVPTPAYVNTGYGTLADSTKGTLVISN